MSRIKERLKQYKDEYSKYSKSDGLYVSEVLEMIEQLQDDMEQDGKENGWIPVSVKMPEEHNSVFAKYKGTMDWGVGMYMKTSAHVLATVRHGDGTILVKQAHTTDGEWKIENSILGGEVITWMPFPEPYKED